MRERFRERLRSRRERRRREREQRQSHSGDSPHKTPVFRPPTPLIPHHPPVPRVPLVPEPPAFKTPPPQYGAPSYHVFSPLLPYPHGPPPSYHEVEPPVIPQRLHSKFAFQGLPPLPKTTTPGPLFGSQEIPTTFNFKGSTPSPNNKVPVIFGHKTTSPLPGSSTTAVPSVASRAVQRVASKFGSLSLGRSSSRGHSSTRTTVHHKLSKGDGEGGGGGDDDIYNATPIPPPPVARPQPAPNQPPGSEDMRELRNLAMPIPFPFPSRQPDPPLIPPLIPSPPDHPIQPPPPVPTPPVLPYPIDENDDDLLPGGDETRVRLPPDFGVELSNRAAELARYGLNYIPPPPPPPPKPAVEVPESSTESLFVRSDRSGGDISMPFPSATPAALWVGNMPQEPYTQRHVSDPKQRDDPDVCVKGSDEDVSTFGIELEFLVATVPQMSKDDDEPFHKDPHPRESRWVSRRLSEKTISDKEDPTDSNLRLFRNYTVRRIVRLLLRNNIQATDSLKTQLDDNIEESDFEDDIKVDWASAARRFTVRATYGPGRTHYQNGLIGFRFVDDFHRFCDDNGYDIVGMTRDDIRAVYERVDECLYDWPRDIHRDQVTTYFEFKLSQSCEDRKALDVAGLGLAEDPLHVEVVGLERKYKAWSVTEDVSVDGNGMVPSRYNIPAFQESRNPMQDYYWFGAEVVSPPLDFDSQQSIAAVQKVCSVLRSNLRCHKPMEVSTGFHVHLGHKHGWNLLQVKRFITLWVLTESAIIHLHRKDRGAMPRWASILMDSTCLAKALFSGSQMERFERAGCKPRSSPGEKTRNMENMARHVDLKLLDPQRAEFILYVWQYATISELTDAMAGVLHEDDFLQPALQLRIRGDKVSDRLGHLATNTIEVRTMHGTLDADHIVQWLAVLRRYLYFSRDAVAEEFLLVTKALSEILKGSKNKVYDILRALEPPPATIYYFMSALNREGDPEHDQDWWLYPDRDRVDWGEPFMVAGHKATHGPDYDHNV
ncbi:hypothetical protein F4811DRAFT_531453 [Daldinia bambusicola]|nr:hypothetical protein F4811DRAFT_531453 [Daldinia bambusicola]